MSDKVVVVTGVPGSGKSTVLDGALKQLSAQGMNYSVMNYGDVMLELMREKGGAKDRDDMRKVPTGRYREIQREAARRIAKAAEKKPIIVDTHCLIKKPEGYYPGLPRWVLEELEPETIVVVEASPEEISGRRDRDKARKRDRQLKEEVDEHQLMNRAAAASYAAFSGANLKIIKNKDKGLNEAVKEMVEALR